MKAIVTALDVFFVTLFFVLTGAALAMGPVSQVSDRESGYLGMGAIRCQAVIAGFDFAKQGDSAQWAFGYLAAIGDDVFHLSEVEQTTRLQSEKAIAVTVSQFIADFCNRHPASLVGDAMNTLRRSYNADAWKAITNPSGQTSD